MEENRTALNEEDTVEGNVSQVAENPSEGDEQSSNTSDVAGNDETAAVENGNYSLLKLLAKAGDEIHSRRRDNIGLFFIGISFGIVMPASLYVVICTCVDSGEAKEMSVIISLLVFHSIGAVSIAVLGAIGFKNERMKYFNLSGTTFFKMKLISVLTFGVVYIFHCGLYIWKPFLNNVNKGIGIASYVVGALHIFLLLIYFAVFHTRDYYVYECRHSGPLPQRKKTCFENALSILVILFTNLGSWVDALSTDCIFETDTDPTQNAKRAMEVIEKTKPLVSSAIIGFSLLTVDFLFPTTANTSLSKSNLQTNDTCTHFNHSADSNKFMKSLFKTMTQHIFFLASFALIAFTFTISLTNNPSADLKAYIITQLSIKLINVLIAFSIICLYGKKCKISSTIISRCSNVWLLMLIFTCVGNISYQIACSFRTESIHNENIKGFIYGDNVASIFLALLQTLFIIGTYGKKNENMDGLCRRKKFVYCACSLLSMMNFGLMISDSLGKEGLIYKSDDCKIWKILYSLGLFLTIIFRFQTGLEFLKLYWHKK